MNKKFWIPTLQLAMSGLIVSAAGGGWKLIDSEIRFHREVRADIAAIKEKLGIQTQNPKENYAAISH